MTLYVFSGDKAGVFHVVCDPLHGRSEFCDIYVVWPFMCFQAIKLESSTSCVIRYMAVVSSVGVQDTEESVIVGVDIQKQEATIGLVLPIWADMTIKLDGDG